MHQQPPKTPLFSSTSLANASQLDSSRAFIVYPDPTTTSASPASTRSSFLGLRGLERAADERLDLALAAVERCSALVLADHRVQHARLGERTHHRRVQHEQQERGG